jgi:hypothetical protein
MFFGLFCTAFSLAMVLAKDSQEERWKGLTMREYESTDQDHFPSPISTLISQHGK